MPHPARRAAAAVLLAAGVSGLLAGCEKPTPLVTIQSRDRVVHSEALCWQREAAGPQNCSAENQAARGQSALETLPVRANEPVLINVDPELEETGWTASLDGVPIVAEPLSTSSYRFDMPLDQLRRNPTLRVQAAGAADAPARGEWAFRIIHRQ